MKVKEAKDRYCHVIRDYCMASRCMSWVDSTDYYWENDVIDVVEVDDDEELTEEFLESHYPTGQGRTVTRKKSIDTGRKTFFGSTIYETEEVEKTVSLWKVKDEYRNGYCTAPRVVGNR